MKLGLGLTLSMLSTALGAQELPRFARYMPLYPGQYFHADYSINDGDEVFAANGDRQGGALPSLAGESRLPRNEFNAAMTWHFPFFESYGLPFISSRTWLGRLRFGYVNTEAEGAVADFAADTGDDASTDADNLGHSGSGIADISFELGTYLFGSPTADWRSRESSPLALQALVGLTINIGEYERDAPVSAGHNTAALHLALGLHAQPWSGGFVDVGLRYSDYFKNQDPAFGGMRPGQVGDTVFWDASLAQRVTGGLYLNLFAQGFDRQGNRYDDPRFSFNPPTPLPGSDARPQPGQYSDAGVRQTVLGLGVEYFLTQRLALGLHYARPVSGRSGEFSLPYNLRTPAGCNVDAVGCSLTPFGEDTVDGLGYGRALASERISLSLSFQFLERDTFDCRGCSQ